MTPARTPVLWPRASAAVAVLIALAPLFSQASHGQVTPGKRERPEKNAQICSDEIQPPAKRLAACTAVLKGAVLGKRTEAKVYDDRANALHALGRRADAIADLSHAIALDPNDVVAHSSRATLYLESGEPDLAIADLSEVIGKDPTVGIALYNRGVAYQRSGDVDKTLDIDPKNARALLGRADTNYARHALAASLDDYTRLIEVDPNNAAAHFKRGNAHFDLQEFSAAISDYSASLELDPDQPAVLYNRALAAERLGRHKDAEQDRLRAHALDERASTTMSTDSG